MLGKRLNFILGTLYARYHLAQPNAKPPSTWKASEDIKWERCIQLQPDPFAVECVLASSQLLSQFKKVKRSGFSNLPLLKQNEEWVPWQRKFELQCKANLCYRIVNLSFDPKTLTDGNYKELWNQ